MLDNISLIAQSAVRIVDVMGRIIYFDPFKLGDEYKNDADYIFITHELYDHFSPEDIEKIINNNTIIVSVPSVIKKASDLQPDEEKRIAVRPNETYEFEYIKFKTTVAYNKNKLFHPKGKEWVGFIITLNDIRYYIAGDTDNLEELQNIDCDVALVPVGGTYTMNYKEAAQLINNINPKYAIPTHYGSVVGSREDATEFEKLVNNNINVKIYI